MTEGSVGSVTPGGRFWVKSQPAMATRYEPALIGPRAKLPSGFVWTMATGSWLGPTATTHAAGVAPLPVTTRPVMRVGAPAGRSRSIGGVGLAAGRDDWCGGVRRRRVRGEAAREVAAGHTIRGLDEVRAPGHGHRPGAVVARLARVRVPGGRVEDRDARTGERSAGAAHGSGERRTELRVQLESGHGRGGSDVDTGREARIRVSGCPGPA